jgi:hypothetical protein
MLNIILNEKIRYYPQNIAIARTISKSAQYSGLKKQPASMETNAKHGKFSV